MHPMKKTALLAAAAAMMMATPAAAQGYLGLEYGNGSVDVGVDQDLDLWQGEGAFGFGGTTNWGGQFDASIGNVSADTGDADFWTLGGHLWWQGSGWRLGGVVTTTSIDDGGSIDETQYGVEGSYDFGPNTSLWSSYTMGEVDSGGASADLSNWDIGANFYASPNVRIGGFIGFGSIDIAGDVDTTSWGINGEFQPWSAPISITAGWNNFEIEDANIEANAFTIGARWNFGGGTLQERNNSTPFDTNTGYVNRLYGIW